VAAASAAAAHPGVGESMKKFSRLLRHLTATGWSLRSAFDQSTLTAIEEAIAASERTHGGEIRIAIESSLNTVELLRDITPRARALQAFGHLGVWDTEANNGVLIYILWADRDVEIVADRGFNGRVSAQEWSEVCQRMEHAFGQGQSREAAIEGIRSVGALIARHFPAVDRDELPNRPVVL
jgi:uncharacterized membrane protein